MKILLATYWPVPHVGGVWGYMTQLKAKLESLGHEVDMLGNGDDEEKSYVYIVNENRRLPKNKLMPLLNAKLNSGAYPALHVNKLVNYAEFQRYVYELSAAYLGLDKYDVIHTQDVISTACISRVRPKHTAMVATLHGCVAHEIRLQLKTIHKSDTEYMARAYYDALEHTGAVSAEITNVANKWLRDILPSEFNVDPHQIRVFQYGFDSESFERKMKDELPIVKPKNKKVIIYTGRLVDVKGVNFLIDALGELKKKRNDWVCWIVGHGMKEAPLRVQAKALGLGDDVVFWGKQDGIPYMLTLADIFVMPSLIDNQPLSLIEAQHTGLACVVSEAGGLPEMVKHYKTGLLFPPADSGKLSRYLHKLLENEELRRELGRNAKFWAASHWNLDKMVRRMVFLYEEAIAKRKGSVDEDESSETVGQLVLGVD
ncbi:glycosyltransferase family 4 protein [Cohnella silvisoli]|uniref:Glycosyltransferase family 4 protein n=1 Tax=Cohnella silvisoli TaxID=2873699 RepID=A0ABV1L204_9BACL|nr:glycosyltransferase family 4 protein [Cohnella silvisoli]MCD9026471.1 glycosyltransferase family 4 protein [Cohnella silvisoli]